MQYGCFHLVLMVTHACNMRCDYCYAGAKSLRSMTRDTGRSAIDRALCSIRQNGILELSFFGGEPLLEADLIEDLIEYAKRSAISYGVQLRLGLTTNGTVATPSAWNLMMRADLDVCISHDGLPQVHDRHRRAGNNGSSHIVTNTIGQLIEAGKDVRAVMVVRPDSSPYLPQGIEWIHKQAVKQIDLTLDVWAQWNRSDIAQLEIALGKAADIWITGLPAHSINWFDEKAAHLMAVPMEATARCRFGDGQIAVAPSGNLYPCERLIADDGAQNIMRLPGHISDCRDFCFQSPPRKSAAPCSECAIQSQCNTMCRCNNYIRTGAIDRPDALLCLLDRVCYRETARVLGNLQFVDAAAFNN
jgi:uncharacterized protein